MFLQKYFRYLRAYEIKLLENDISYNNVNQSEVTNKHKPMPSHLVFISPNYMVVKSLLYLHRT